MSKIRFNPEISLGNLLSIITLIITVITVSVKLEHRFMQIENTEAMHAWRIEQVEKQLEDLRPVTSATPGKGAEMLRRN